MSLAPALGGDIGLFADAVAAGLVGLASDRRILLWNRWMVEHSGISATDAIGRTLPEVFPETAATRLASAIDYAIDKRMAALLSPALNGNTLRIYSSPEHRSPDKRMKYLVQVIPLRDQSIAGACLLQINDMSAALKRERQLRQQADDLRREKQLGIAIQDRLSGILDNVQEAILTIDKDGIVLKYNQAAERIFGYNATEVVGSNVKILMPARYADEHDEYLARYHRERTARIIGIGRKVLGKRKSGEVFPMQLAVTEVQSIHGQEFIGLVRDVSEEEKARERLEQAVQTITERERFIRAVTDALPGLLAYWDRDLRCHFANRSYLEWFNKTPDEVLGGTLLDLLGERVFALNQPYIQGALAGTPQKFERVLTKADGSAGYTWANYIPDIDVDGTVIGFYVLVTDVTPLKEAEAELELAASVFQSTAEGITVTNPQGVILSVNPSFTEITGYSAAEAIGQTPRMLKSNRHDQAFYAAMWQEITRKGRWKGDIWNRRKDGQLYLERMTITMIRDSMGAPLRYVSVFNDITDLWRNDEQLRRLAFRDGLTDLPNRILLMDRFNRQHALAQREKRELAVMFLDLDRFKHVNDTLGHNVGDEVLKAVALKLKAEVRQADTVARLGGDEFVVLLDNPVNTDEVARIASRIVAVINEPMELCGKVAEVGTSIGIALHPTDGNSPDELLKNADIAMYAAKAAGKNTYRFFVDSMTRPLATSNQTA
jgi:diguanylate cyclase (GGDEF)-like protein/PAS domain S-box-containing protein